MVYYLGFDFLQNALSTRRALMSRCLLAVPQHGKHAGVYPHKGNLTDQLYRVPWKKAAPDFAFLEEEIGLAFRGPNGIVGNEIVSELEVFESDTLLQEINFDLYEFVPSSNPDSSQELEFDEIPETIFQDALIKYSIKDMQSSVTDYCLLSSGKGREGAFEDVKMLTSFHFFCKGLQPRKVKDPFVEKDGRIIREEDLFPRDKLETVFQREDCAIIDSEENHTCSSLFSEEPEKFTFDPNQSELEDVLILFINYRRPEGHSQITTNIKTQLEEEKDLGLGDKNKAGALSSCLSELKDLCPKLECDLSLEKSDLSPRVLHQQHFIDVNNLDVCEEKEVFSKAELEAPLCDSQDYMLSRSPLAPPSLTTLPVSPYKPSLLSKYVDEGSVLEKVWLKEKYFEELLSLRLKEPETEPYVYLKPESSVQAAVICILPLTPERTADIELSLGWDMVRQCTVREQDCLHVSKLEYSQGGVTSPSPRTGPQRDDLFRKYTNADLCDLQDMRALKVSKKAEEIKPKQELQDTEEMKSKEVSRKMSFPASFDPLQNFIAIRSSVLVNDEPQLEKAVSDVAGTEMVKEGKNELSNSAIKKSKRKKKCKILSVRLSDEFQVLHKHLEEKASGLILSLKELGDISKSYEFRSLTPDVTRFLLRQKEKLLTDAGKDFAADDTYRLTIALHALSGAGELLTVCCLESAIAYLTTLREKYESVLKGTLQTVRQKLFESKISLYERQIYHPKIAALCREVEDWLRKKTSKSDECHFKVLVIVKRDLPTFMNCLKSALEIGNLIKPSILTEGTPDAVIQQLDSHNCLLSATNKVSETFPWAQFSLVVEYEWQLGSVWQDHCLRQNIRYLALHAGETEENGTQCHISDVGMESDKIVTLIGSQKLLANTDLLQVLETRYNILFLERDYSMLKSQPGLVYPDIDIDEATCMIVVPLSEVCEVWHLEPLVRMIISFSLKYLTCWIVLYPKNKTRYPYPGSVTSSLYKLQASLSNFCAKSKDYSAKVVLCPSVVAVAKCVRQVCELRMSADMARPVDQWLDRDWLTADFTKMEKLLLQFPCLSSFNAQRLASRFSMKDLLCISQEDLESSLPSLPSKIIQTFCTAVNSDSGLQLLCPDSPQSDSSAIGDLPSQQEYVVAKYSSSHFQPLEHSETKELMETEDQGRTGRNYRDADILTDADTLCDDEQELDTDGSNHSCRDFMHRDAYKSDFMLEFLPLNSSDLCCEMEKNGANCLLEKEDSSHSRAASFMSLNTVKERGQGEYKSQSRRQGTTFMEKATGTPVCSHVRNEKACAGQNQSKDLQKICKNRNKEWVELDNFVRTDLQRQRRRSKEQSDVLVGKHGKYSLCRSNVHPEEDAADSSVPGLVKIPSSWSKLHHGEVCSIQQDKPTLISSACSNCSGNVIDSHVKQNIQKGANMPSRDFDKIEQEFDFKLSKSFPDDEEMDDLDCDVSLSQKPNQYVLAEMEGGRQHTSINDMEEETDMTQHCAGGADHQVPWNDHFPRRPKCFTEGTANVQVDKVDRRMVQHSCTSNTQDLRVDDQQEKQSRLSKLIDGFLKQQKLERTTDFSDGNRHSVDTLLETESKKSTAVYTCGMKTSRFIENSVDCRKSLKLQEVSPSASLFSSSNVPYDSVESQSMQQSSSPEIPTCLPSKPLPLSVEGQRKIICSNGQEMFVSSRQLSNRIKSQRDCCQQYTPVTTAGDGDRQLVQVHTGKFKDSGSMIRQVQVDAAQPQVNRDFGSTLAETTRRLLCKSQFPSFGGHLPRPPLQRVSIGLAQPLRRQNPEVKSQKEEMQNSLWTMESSPPMDLDSDPPSPELSSHTPGRVQESHSARTNRPQQPDWGTKTNQSVFTSEYTPQKKRKLTYVKIPGTKGQTKLSFK